VNPDALSVTASYSSLTTRRVSYFLLPFSITVNQISFYLNLVLVPGTVKACIYTANGSKVIDATSDAISTLPGINTVAVPSVTLAPGAYYSAIGCATSCNHIAAGGPIEAIGTIFGAGTPSGKLVYHGTVTHAAGGCDSTLGAVAGDANPMIGFRLDN
jgi:hypothetical protein